MASCPDCGGDLVPVGRRIVAVELLFWVALALLLAFLWSAGPARELYAGLAVLGFAAWWFLRVRRRAYYCGRCRRSYDC